MNNKYLSIKREKIGEIVQSEIIISIFNREFSISYNRIGQDFSITFRFLNYERII